MINENEDKISIDGKIISLAAGYIYLINFKETDKFKIGFSLNLEKRIKSIASHFPEPDSIILIAHQVSINPRKDEKELHKLLASYRLRGEWFKFDSIEQAKELFAEFFDNRYPKYPHWFIWKDEDKFFAISEDRSCLLKVPLDEYSKLIENLDIIESAKKEMFKKDRFEKSNKS